MNDPLDELGKKIKQQKPYNKPEKEKKPEKAIFIATEIVVGTVVGGIIGYYIDKLLATKALFLLSLIDFVKSTLASW